MTYHVRVYCLDCFEMNSAECPEGHPALLGETFTTILEANIRGQEAVTANDEWEWEVLDEAGNVVC
jgi:hypothetical protein